VGSPRIFAVEALVGHWSHVDSISFVQRGSAGSPLWVTSAHTEVLNFYRALGFQETGATASLRPGSPVTITELELGPGSDESPRRPRLLE